MTYSSEVLADSPAFYLKMNEASGSSAADSSGNGRNATMIGGSWVGDSGVTGAAAWAQNGTSGQYGTVTGFTTNYNAAVTLEAWVKPAATQPAAKPVIIGKGSYYAKTNVDFPVSLYLNAGKFAFDVDAGGNFTTNNTLTPATTYTADQWYHVVGVFQNGTSRLYVNGVEAANAATAFNLSSTTYEWFVGTMADYGGGAGASRVNGRLAHLAVYPTALSAARVSAHYSAGAVVAGTVVAGGQATSTNAALAGSTTLGSVIAGGLSTTANVALAGSLLVGALVAGGQAVESDSARAGALVNGELVVGGKAVEADSAAAGSVVAGALVVGGQTTEADSALAGAVVVPAAGDIVVGGQALEADTARPGVLVLPYTQTDRTNRAGGIDVSGTLPLVFNPVVDPAPTRAAKRRVIRAAAFNNVDVTGTVATYTVDEEKKRRLRERYVIGGKDATYINGAETTLTWQLVSPLLYGPATATLPGVKTPFRRVGFGTLKWLKKGATVRVDLVNDADEVVERGVYKGLIQSHVIDGTDVTVQIGGEASGRAAMKRRPLPVYSSQDARVRRIAFSLIKNLGLTFRPFLGEGGPNIVIPRIGGMWYLEAIEYLCKMSQRRDGTQYSIMPDSDGVYRYEPKDTTTVHATAYIDGTRVKANVRSDMVEEPNRIFANSVAPNGRRYTGIVSPGIHQGDPPPWDGAALSIGDSGPRVTLLVKKLHWAGLLDVEDRGDFDADIEEAVKDLQELADLDVTGVVNEATWNALFDIGVSGYSLRWAHREPAAQESKVRKWLVTPNGSIRGRNPRFDPTVPVVDQEMDLGSFIAPQMRRNIARGRLAEANTANWVGTVEVPMGAVIAGEHNPGDPLTAADLMDFRLLKPGMNLWCPGFQSDTGTLFHITGVDVASQVLQVDTRARDTLEVDDVIRRNREERMWRRGRRASIETKDVVGEWDGPAGGLLYNDFPVAAGKWNVFAVPAGDEGTISRLRLNTSPGAEFMVAIFGGPHRNDALADALDRRMGDPFTEVGFANWDDRDKRAWLRDKHLLYMAGSPDDPCGYDPKAKSRGGTITGEFADDAGIAYRSDFPALWVAVWSPTDTVIPASRIMWNQLEPGA